MLPFGVFLDWSEHERRRFSSFLWLPLIDSNAAVTTAALILEYERTTLVTDKFLVGGAIGAVPVGRL